MQTLPNYAFDTCYGFFYVIVATAVKNAPLVLAEVSYWHLSVVSTVAEKLLVIFFKNNWRISGLWTNEG